MLGSNKYIDKIKVKNKMFELKKKFGSRLVILSGGEKCGAESYVKKHAIDLELKYHEYNSAHTQKNAYSMMHEAYYGKPYHASQYFHKTNNIIKNSHIVVIFQPLNEENSGMDYAKKRCEKLGIKYYIVN